MGSEMCIRDRSYSSRQTKANFSQRKPFILDRYIRVRAQHSTTVQLRFLAEAPLHASSGQGNKYLGFRPPSLIATCSSLGTAVRLAMALHIAAGMSLRPSSLVVAFCGILLLDLLPSAVGKCPNWCSQSGICTGPGDDAFCICEMGYQGDDCATRESRDM